MKNNRGFSLLELLIVVAIILIIATIAIPSLLRSRQSANETAAVANLRTMNTAEVTYASGTGGTFGRIADLVTAGLLDARFSEGGTISGYTLTSAAAGGTYTIGSIPSGTSGRYNYVTYEDGVTRYGTSPAPGAVAGGPVR